jgi:hypothetical protein
MLRGFAPEPRIGHVWASDLSRNNLRFRLDCDHKQYDLYLYCVNRRIVHPSILKSWVILSEYVSSSLTMTESCTTSILGQS